MKKIFVCSPYRGDVEKNRANALRYRNMAVRSGYLPYVPHLYFPQFLDDHDPEQREAGMAAGLEWLEICAEVWVFGKPTEGMQIEIFHAEKLGKKVRWFNAGT